MDADYADDLVLLANTPAQTDICCVAYNRQQETLT